MTDKQNTTILVAGSEAQVLNDSDRMQLTCGASGCRSTCCKAEAPIILNPYEIALICRETGMPYEDLLDIVDTDRVNGFPLVMLPRDPVCHFWAEHGCRIYTSRPLACRLFPLGRVYEKGSSYIVLPGVNRCTGIIPSSTGTVAEYLTSQDTSRTIEMADHWIAFVENIERLCLPDAPVTSVAFHMLVYSPDTPPSAEPSLAPSSPEERYLLRLDTAAKKLPLLIRHA